jgi:gliding motility-associated protein GldM
MGAKNCEETPRQKMISMMYLVLTALLALNVSKDILNAFIVVNESMEQTNITLTKKVQGTYDKFDQALLLNREKVQENFDKAQKVRVLSDEMVALIDEIKIKVICETEGLDFEETKSAYLAFKDGKSEINPIAIREIDKKDNFDIPTNFFCGDSHDATNGEGIVLKEEIDTYRTAILSFLEEKDREFISSNIGLLTDEEYTDLDGKKVNWMQQNFYHTILVADVVLLNKMISEIRNAEADVVAQLYTAVDADDFKFDKIDAKVIAKSNYILTGEEFVAEIFVAAYDSKKPPEITVGSDVDSVSFEISGAQVEIEEFKDGMGIYKVPAGAPGLKTYGGVISVKAPSGGTKRYAFSGEYVVAQPSATVSPTKMNVFYIGVDNPVSISVPGVPTENVRPSISNGSLSKTGNGEYIVKVTGGTSATINVGAEMSDGANKSMGSFEFRVKRVPSPVATIAGKVDGSIGKGSLLGAGAIIPVMENFDFELYYVIVGFDMLIQTQGQDLATAHSNNGSFTGQMKQLIQNSARGKRVTFEKIRARGPDGSIRQLSPVVFTIM